jgi:DNA-binding transcriptional LysR family regulator
MDAERSDAGEWPRRLEDDMDLRQLRYALAVAEEGSVTRAAARLHLSQPPLSLQLARLEKELGVVLFRRHRRGLEPTEAGQELISAARRIFAELEAVRKSVQQLGEGASGQLRVACMPAAMWGVFPDLLASFRKVAPQMRVQLAEGSIDDVAENVLTGQSEFGVVHLPPSGFPSQQGTLTVHVLDREPMVVALSAELASALPESVNLGALEGFPLITIPTGRWGGPQPLARNACRVYGVEPNLLIVQHVESILMMVRAGMGYGLFVRSAGRAIGEGIVLRPFDRELPLVETAVLTAPNVELSPVARRFAAHIGVDLPR